MKFSIVRSFATTPEGEAQLQEFVATAIMPSAEAFQRGDVEEGVRTFADGVLGAGAYEDLDSEIRANMMQNARELELVDNLRDQVPIQ